MGQPTLVVISGPPRAGKTTLAHDLARAIPCFAICRDEIKEGMVHAAGGNFKASAGDPLTQRTFPLFFETVRVLLAGGVTVVAEASFQDELWKRGLEPLADLARMRVVQCHADPAIARLRRREAVAAGQTAHAIIVGDDLEDWKQAYASFDRLSLPEPSIDVDTTDGYSPPLDEIVAFASA
jgi:predicted kinase